ncbi:hypothetical protein A9975_16660 [Cupriavidus sp. UME77]|nr:hypothetical protein [Cupriavidus sp. UME77]
MLVALQGDWGVSCNLSNERCNTVGKRSAGEHAADQTDLVGLFSGQRTSCIEHFERDTTGYQARKEDGAEVRTHATPRFRQANAGIFDSHAQITCERQLAPGSQCHTVDYCDRWLGCFEHHLKHIAIRSGHWQRHRNPGPRCFIKLL